MSTLPEIEADIAAAANVEDAEAYAARALALGEAVLSLWLEAHGQAPTGDTRESFRLLALHRQGAKDDPSFNACRETCRELAWHYNLLTAEPGHAETDARRRMMQFVLQHLFLFVGGKLGEAKLGDFCCASRPIRQAG